MGKRKGTPLAEALAIVDKLNADDQQTLADYLRSKLQTERNPRQSKSKRSLREVVQPDEKVEGATA